MNQPARLGTGQRERRAIRLRGLVQGVGFRPHVYRCAAALGLAGFVRNGPQGVTIEVEGTDLDRFVRRLREELPPLARIDTLTETPLLPTGETGFHIAETEAGAANGAAIPADVALCADCLRELFDPADRRYLHPFIACCNCGPRYSMTRRLPYDRHNTAMADFPLCPACQSEYGDPASRRFHAEPVACHDCGPRLSGSVAASAAAIGAGEIVALKGVGGYHLCCDARDEQAVARLRGAKRRDGKPLAVMVLNRASAAQWARLDAAALDRLESAERPVVIAETPVDTPAGTCSASADADRRAPTGPGTRAATATAPGLAAGVSRGLGTLGLMLPGTGLHYLLFHALLGRPDGRDWLDRANGLALVMTSANLSGEPLVIDAEAAERELGDIADRFLHHDREIAARVDDSVVRAVPGGGERPSASMLVRRARGYAPHAIGLSRDGPGVLALGPHLKTTLTMTRGDRAWLSPHIGDLESAAAIAFHRRAASLLESMLQDRPQLIACDLNPDYASSRLAESLAAGRGLPLVTVQHHHAHIAALLAEYRLEQPVLGLALDGHGLGWDGEAWGGELLRVDGARCERLGHLAALPLPGGDRAAREPWRMAAGALHTMGRGDEIARRFPEQPMAADLGRWLAAGAVSGTTAAGRLFDAAAGLLGVCQLSSFEGEAPMRLEALARGELEGSDQYRLDGGVLDFGPLLATLAEERDPARGARLFHGTLVRGLAAWAARAAGRAGIDTVALGGGCFLNARLAIELPRELRRAGLRPLLPRAVPPNDAAVSLGQAWVAQRTEI